MPAQQVESTPPTDQVKRKEISVYVTGFAPFGKHTVNPSFLIVSALPTSLRPDKANYTITITCHPAPIHVSYQTVLSTVPEIYASHNFDYVIHVGVGSEGAYYLETLAHRDGYTKADVDELSAPMAPDGRQGFPTLDAEEELTTEIDVESVLEAVRKTSNVAIEKSTDPGRYLCDFIFYTSLYEAIQRFGEREGRAKVLFVHVPPENMPYSIAQGVQTLKQVIEEVVGCGEGSE